MHQELETELEELKRAKKTLMTGISAELSKGLEHVNTKDLMDAVDMVKDFAETECQCRMACYYEAITKAMEEGGNYGYNPNRSRDTGRFTSRDRMGYSGDPEMDRVALPFIQDYLSTTGMGYPMRTRITTNDNSGSGGRDSYGYSNADDRYGRSYRKWRDARRYYTETKSPEGAEMMHTAANETVADTLVTLRDIWSGADVELKKQMKADMSKLLSEMNV